MQYLPTFLVIYFTLGHSYALGVYNKLSVTGWKVLTLGALRMQSTTLQRFWRCFWTSNLMLPMNRL